MRPSPLREGCPCAACVALRAEIGADAGLVALYGKKLLYQGWAGTLTPAERAYRVSHSTKARHAAELGRRQQARLRANPIPGERSPEPAPHCPAPAEPAA